MPLASLVTHARPGRAGVADALQHVFRHRHHRQRGAGRQLGTGDRQMDGIADRLMPRETMAREWTELAYLQEDAGNLALFIFGLAVIVRLPGAGGAVRELDAAAGGHSGGADVPALLHLRS